MKCKACGDFWDGSNIECPDCGIYICRMCGGRIDED